MNSSIVAPSFRLLNRAVTGTLVPLNTHAPLTLPGLLSMAVHVLQFVHGPHLFLPVTLGSVLRGWCASYLCCTGRAAECKQALTGILYDRRTPVNRALPLSADGARGQVSSPAYPIRRWWFFG